MRDDREVYAIDLGTDFIVETVNKKILHTVYEEAARRFPDRIAIRHGERGVTYRELGRAVDETAVLLQEAGVGKDIIAGVILDSGIEYVAAIIAVMKAGGVFLPLDMSFPEKRLEAILRKTPPSVIISGRDPGPLGRLEATGCRQNAWPVVILDEELRATVRVSGTPRARGTGTSPGPDDGCYIMYTSGSSGLPKAILGCHKSLSHFVHWEVTEFGLDENIRVTQLPPVTFDASLRDIFVPLITGGTLCIPEKEVRTDIRRLIGWMEREGITLMHCVPSLFRMVTRELGEMEGGAHLLSALKYILMAGEPLYGKDVIRWMDLMGERTGLVNLYGPSETTLVKTFYRILQRPSNLNTMLPAGHPISNTAVLITKGARLCEPGEIGEILIKTPFRTKGYYNDPELTNKSFVPNPLTHDPADIVYKTGDMGRYLADRGIEYIGRLDTQVKVNGIRIELGEIEQVLLGLGFIDQAVVVSHRSPENENVLVCYYSGNKTSDAGEVSAWLRSSLPSYMIPSFYVRLDEFPLNINGKIDKKALPRPEELIYAGTEYEPAADGTERALARIWAEVLNLKRVGVNSPFFHIGGHSLTATRVLSRIYREFGKEISLRDFFGNPTVRKLADLLRRKGVSAFEQIPVLGPGPDYALSHSQQRLWILDQMEEDSVAYSLPGLFLVEGSLDITVLRRAFSSLIERHESLRTTFIRTAAGPRQRIHDIADALAGFDIEEVDFSGSPNGRELALKYARERAAVPFDLARGPLMRATVIILPEEGYAIFFNIHHIIGDAWSFDVLAGDLMDLYEAYLAGKENPLVPLRVQYKDFAAWQNAQLQADESKKMARYWHEKLSGSESSALDLPFDFMRPPLQTYKGRASFISLDERLTAGLEGLAQRHDASMFMLLLALLKVLLYRYTGQNDIIVGSPVACRNHPDLEDQIGFYANTLALRDKLHREESFVSVLEKVKKTAIDAYDHQEYPFDRLVNELGLLRDPGRAPLFDVMLVYRDEEQPPAAGRSLRIRPAEVETETSRFDLTLEVERSSGRLRIGIIYNTGLFRAATIGRMAAHFSVLAENVIVGATGKIKDLDILGPGERRLLTHTFNDTQRPWPKDKTIVDIFGERAASIPDRTAVVLQDRDLSYGELHARSLRLAETLIMEHQVRPGDIVGLMVDRNEWSVVGLMGILMAGGVYLPVDPAYPKERISHMLQDSGCRLLLAEGKYIEEGGYFSALVNSVEIARVVSARSGSCTTGSLPGRPSPEDPAYIIYTSGSTGKPKGVMIKHGGFLNMSLDQIRSFEVSETDRVLQFASASFDASLSEIFMALLAGAAVVLVTKETIYDPLAFVQYLEDKKVTHVTLPPAYLTTLDKEGLKTVTTIITAGEAPNRQDAMLLSRSRNYFNAYGPTEVSVCASIQRVSPEEEYDRAIPIGSPVANTSIYILDEDLKVVPIGITGEICISGAGLAMGYINRPELTAEKFVSHPYEGGGRLYRTGDMGRWRPDGTIELSGRKDDQIKIRGYRIEPGEIRSVLLQHKWVNEAVVIERGKGHGELAVYFTAGQNLAPSDLKYHLRKFLPDYMVPSCFIQLKALPVNFNGKIDKKALPDPESVLSPREGAGEGPRNRLEERLLALWREVLAKKTLGVHDNFFDSGGNSLRALQLISLISTELDIKVPVKHLFMNPTVAALSVAIGRTVQYEARPPQQSGASVVSSKALTLERKPLMSLFDTGRISPVDAAAITCLPDSLIDSPGPAGLRKDEIIRDFCEGQPVLSSITQTFMGRIAVIVIPHFASEVFSDKGALQKSVTGALCMAARLGAQTVSLTGNLPLATDFGFDVVTAFQAGKKLPAITTGQATVAAAMVMTIENILQRSGRRQFEQETVGLVGLNTIGSAVLLLMLQCMPHPKRILMADAYNNLLFASVLRQELSDLGFRGSVGIMKASDELPSEFYEATLLIGVTNVPEIIDIDRVKPGTIVIEESGQRCFSQPRAARRLETEGDILFTEGDLLQLPSPSTCILYLPDRIETSLRRAGKASLVSFKPYAITGCVLSGLLSQRYPFLKPTIGEVDGETCLRHYRLLRELGFGAADLHCEGYEIKENLISRFREDFGAADALAGGKVQGGREKAEEGTA